ncbi:MAG TPA: hypothetical protein VJY63_02825 [Marinospirillum sp.]|uniref:hypothetical protein n=1 Tax=Marinospirillum sp. TaxID=2183934 RepID=UPI002B497A1F|nr:hypothetical protein [Marinospirillum sp.]HKM14846.1 hypothetical protein [Marinospirillum sp.]
MINTFAKVQQLEALTNHVYRVTLQLDTPAFFLPGQYLEIQVMKNEQSEGHWQAFSIASLPDQKQIQLHIQRLPARENSQQLFSQLKEGANLTIRLASGQCVLHGKDRPLTLIAAGTGFAQIKSLIEALIEKNWQSPINFYWAAKDVDGLYDLELAQAWQNQLADFTLIPIVEEVSEGWQGEVGRVTDVLANDYDETNTATTVEGFICGSPNMVYAVEDLLMSRGMPPRALLSDVHAYMPRDY